MANENPNGSPNNNRQNDQNDNKQKGGFPSWLILLAIVALITIFGNQIVSSISGRNSEKVRYDQFLSAVNQDEVAKVTISNEDIRYVLRADKDKTFEKVYYTSVVPGVELTNLVIKMQKNGVEMTGGSSSTGRTSRGAIRRCSSTRATSACLRTSTCTSWRRQRPARSARILRIWSTRRRFAPCARAAWLSTSRI